MASTLGYNNHKRLNLDKDNMKVIDELFDNVVLSLDGDEATNDRMRLTDRERISILCRK